MSADPMPRAAAYTIRQAREMLGNISQATVYSLIRRGQLRTFRVGRRRFVSDKAIQDFIAAAERESLENAG